MDELTLDEDDVPKMAGELEFEEEIEVEPQPEYSINPKKKMQKQEGDPNKENFLSYDGSAGKVFKIALLNFFLTIITLGIYRFWGKTRMRKYLVGSFTLDGDRFEYTGTGKELFIGFLKAFPIVLVLLLPITFFGEENPAVLLLYVPFYYLFGIAIYGALRYRYSRTRWRGIRCILRGSMIEYANLSVIRAIINVFTLGFAIPYSDIKKHKYIIENSCFGSVYATYKGNARNIYKAYLLSLVLTPLMILPAGFLFGLPIMMEAMGAGARGDGKITGLIFAICYLLGLVFAVVLLPLGRAIYQAALMREKARGIVAGDIRFSCDVTALELLKFQVVNVLIIIFTLGFGFAWVIQRRMEFIIYHNTIIGDLDTSEIFQGDAQGITSGEGLEDALDLDVGLF